jgi:hypothetical protein
MSFATEVAYLAGYGLGLAGLQYYAGCPTTLTLLAVVGALALAPVTTSCVTHWLFSPKSQ